MLLPHLSGLARLTRVVADRRVSTAGVFASGRLLVNPDWFGTLALPERIFVAAHELMHLALRTHERCGGSDARLFNVAHDYVINDMLRRELRMDVPAGGMNLPGAAGRSAESIVTELRSRRQRGEGLPGEAWSGGPTGALGEALTRAGIGRAPLSGAGLTEEDAPVDALDANLERRWFPDDGEQEQRRAERSITAESDRALSLGVLRERMENVFSPPPADPQSGHSALVETLETRLRPPWEMALQRWLEDAAPGTRSFSRPSRRQGDRSDVVLPGRLREGWTLNLVLDTSGSMWEVLPKVLGVLRGFCEAAGVATVRILQCGEMLEADELVPVHELDRYRIRGGRNGDLKPGFYRLAEDPTVEAVLVITDGGEDYPREPMFYRVLWAITREVPEWFEPGYGTVLRIGD